MYRGGCEELAARIRSKCRRRKRGTGAQNRHGGAPGGERPALWDARRLDRRLACRVTCRPNGCLASTRRLSALRHPSLGEAKRKFQNPGAENAPRERGRLFNERLPQVDGGGAKKQ